MPPLRVKNSQPTISFAPQASQGTIQVGSPASRPLNLTVAQQPQIQQPQMQQPQIRQPQIQQQQSISIPQGPPPVAVFNDNAGLAKNLQSIDSYRTEDQVRILQRASKSNMLSAEQKAAASDYIQKSLANQPVAAPKFSNAEKASNMVTGFAKGLYHDAGDAIDVLNAGRQGVGGLIDYGVHSSGSDAQKQAILNKTNKAMNYSLNASHGLITPDEAQNADLFGNAQERSKFLNPVGRGTLRYAPYAIAPELAGAGGKLATGAVGAAMPEATSAYLGAARLGLPTALAEKAAGTGFTKAIQYGSAAAGGGLINTVFGGAGNVRQGDSALDVLKKAPGNFGVGAALGVADVGLRDVAKAGSNAYANRTPLDERGSVQLPGKRPNPNDINVHDLSQAAVNSLENDKTGMKPGGVERSGTRVENATSKPVEYRMTPEGQVVIVDGRHTLEYARQKGITDYPMKDVTEQFNPGNADAALQRMHEQNNSNMVSVRPDTVAVTDHPGNNFRQELPPEPQGVDYSKVEGSAKEYQKAVNDHYQQLRDSETAQRNAVQKTDLFQQIKSSGGIGHADHEVPTFLKRSKGMSMDRVAQELGFADDQALKDAIDRESAVRDQLRQRGAPTPSATLRAAAEQHVSEHPSYAELRKRVAAEQELANYAAADKQSGYDKAKLRQNDKGRKSGMTSAQIEKISSPEYADKKAAGDFLQRIRDELPGAKQLADAVKKQAKGKVNPDQITELNAKYAHAIMRVRQLEGLERQYAGEYKRTAVALDEKYPETALYRNGKVPRNTTSISGVPADRNSVAVTDRPVQVGDQAVAAANSGDLKSIAAATRPETAPTGDAMNAQSYEAVFGVPYEEGLHHDELGTSYNPTNDHFVQDTAAPLQPRNLAGDTAAFNAILDGKSLEQAAQDYHSAAGGTIEEANKAVNLMAETGQGMGTAESVLKRNPAYGNVELQPVKTAQDAAQISRSYGKVLDRQVGILRKMASKLSVNDTMLLDQLRGNKIEDVAAQAENPSRFTKVAEQAKNIQDYIHEVRRLHGDDTIYRQDYGAGLHLKVETPEDVGFVHEMRTNLANTPGWSNARHFNDYAQVADKYGLQRQNGNFVEDIMHDARTASGFVKQRSLLRNLQEINGNDKVSWGQTRTANLQIPGHDDLFASKDVRDQVAKYIPKSRDGGSALWKPYDAATSLATQAIVLNPVFHGANQLVQGFIASGNAAGLMKGPLGGLSYMKNYFDLSNVRDMGHYTDRMLEAGETFTSYGKDRQTITARLTKNLSNVNRTAMAAIDHRSRVAAFKTLVDSGVEDRAAVKMVDHFLGDESHMSAGVQRGTLFLHYFKTMGGALASHATHPVANAGATVNLAIAGATVVGLSAAWQKATGNNDAYVRAPGELGLAKELYKAGREVQQGHYRQAAGIATNRVNPILKEGVSQLYGHDLYTGNPIQDRKSHALQATLSPAQVSGNVQAGKKSGLEVVENQLQLYTPHAKGYQASDKITVLNTPNAKAGNGLLGQRSYYASNETATKTLVGNDRKRYDAITSSENDDAGKSIGSDDKQAQAKNLELSANPRVLAAVSKQKQEYARLTGQKLDPLYDDKQISPENRATYLRIQGTPYKSDDYTKLSADNAQWLKPFLQARSGYFKGVDFSTAPKSERTQPPQFAPGVQDKLTQSGNLSGKEKGQYISDNPDLQNAYDQIAEYTNNKRIGQGYDPYNLYPKAPADVQETIKAYNALPQHDGAKGGNATRAKWIAANPEKYGNMTDFFTKVGVYELAGSAGQAKYQGSDFTQKDLKNIYNLGQYDIKKGTDAKGNAAYAYANQVDAGSSTFNQGGSSYYVKSDKKGGYSKGGGSGGAQTHVPFKAIKQQTYFTRFKGSKITHGGKGKVNIKHSKVRVGTINSKIRVT